MLAHLKQEAREVASPHKKYDSMPGRFDYIKWVIWFDRMEQSQGMHLEGLKYPSRPILNNRDDRGRYVSVKLHASFSSSASSWIHASDLWCEAPDLAWVQRFVWVSKDSYPGGSVELVLRALVVRDSLFK